MYYKIVRKLFQRAARKMCLECQGFIAPKGRYIGQEPVIKKGSEILDLGCGSGVVGKEFGVFFKANILGIDIKDQRVEKIPFQIFDGYHIPFPENSFDVVLINYVLHHSQDPIALLREAKRVFKDKIIIFEDLAEGFLSKLICKIHGATFNYFFQKSKGKDNFKESREWKKIFENLKLKLIFEKRVSSIFNPVKKKLFILEKEGA